MGNLIAAFFRGAVPYTNARAYLRIVVISTDTRTEVTLVLYIRTGAARCFPTALEMHASFASPDQPEHPQRRAVSGWRHPSLHDRTIVAFAIARNGYS